MPRDIGLIASDSRYIKHPAAAAADSFVKDGRPIDAGTAHVITNNLNVLHRESGRHLLTWLGPGDISQPTSNGWSALNEEIPDSAHRTTTETEIAWNVFASTQPTAVCDGPFFIGKGREDLSSTYGANLNLLSRVRFWLSWYSDGAASFKAYFAATAGPAPPSSGYIALATATTTSATLVHTSATLDLTSAQRRPWQSGASGASDCDEVYLWLGWRWAAAPNGWLSCSAYEVLETST